MNRRKFIKKASGIFVPTAFGIFVPKLLKAGPPFAVSPRSPYRNSLFKPSGGGGGGSCTLHTGDTFNESFEGTDSNTWTDTGTVDRNAALPGTSPCDGLGNECLAINWNGIATKPFSSWDRGSALNATLYTRFYFNIASHSLVDTDHYVIFAVNEIIGGTRNWSVEIHYLSGLNIHVLSGTDSAEIAISSATWYRVEVKYIPNNGAGGSEFKLFNAAGSQIDTTKTFNTGNNWFREIRAGLPTSDDTKAFQVAIDGIGVDSTGYLGT